MIIIVIKQNLFSVSMNNSIKLIRKKICFFLPDRLFFRGLLFANCGLGFCVVQNR